MASRAPISTVHGNMKIFVSDAAELSGVLRELQAMNRSSDILVAHENVLRRAGDVLGLRKKPTTEHIRKLLSRADPALANRWCLARQSRRYAAHPDPTLCEDVLQVLSSLDEQAAQDASAIDEGKEPPRPSGILEASPNHRLEEMEERIHEKLGQILRGFVLALPTVPRSTNLLTPTVFSLCGGSDSCSQEDGSEEVQAGSADSSGHDNGSEQAQASVAARAEASVEATVAARAEASCGLSARSDKEPSTESFNGLSGLLEHTDAEHNNLVHDHDHRHDYNEHRSQANEDYHNDRRDRNDHHVHCELRAVECITADLVKANPGRG